MSVNQPVAKFVYKDKEIIYAVANDHTIWRVKSIWTKEPDTMAWIESMPEGDIFLDVGANMGIYSIFAAARGLQVYAFEPESSNYQLLCRSIMFNGFDQCTAYPVAISNVARADVLYLSMMLPGGSCHTVGENLDHRLEKRESEIKQGCISLPLDWFQIRPYAATDAEGNMKDHNLHIKIDVDGLEHKVIQGAAETLSQAKSVLIEINQKLPEHMKMVDYMESTGFRYDISQVEKATRKEGTFKDCGNWIFYRK